MSFSFSNASAAKGFLSGCLQVEGRLVRGVAFGGEVVYSFEMGIARWLIVGLGNPGDAYEGTRHNVGFQVIHRLARESDLPGKREKRFEAMVASGFLTRDTNREHPVILAQPLTYMNLSGRAVQKIMAYYDIPPERLIVIYDERALPLGKIRVREKGRAAGHNGIKSIMAALGGCETFGRVRIGIGEPVSPQSMTNHVLSKFPPDEAKIIEDVITMAWQATEMIVFEGFIPTMNTYNGLDAHETKSP